MKKATYVCTWSCCTELHVLDTLEKVKALGVCYLVNGSVLPKVLEQCLVCFHVHSKICFSKLKTGHFRLTGLFWFLFIWNPYA